MDNYWFYKEKQRVTSTPVFIHIHTHTHNTHPHKKHNIKPKKKIHWTIENEIQKWLIKKMKLSDGSFSFQMYLATGTCDTFFLLMILLTVRYSVEYDHCKTSKQTNLRQTHCDALMQSIAAVCID